MRSLWIRAAVGLFFAVLVASAAMHAARVWTERQFTSEVGSLDPSDYTRPPVKSEANAARFFLAAAGKLRLEPDDAQLLASWAASPQAVDERLVAILGRNEAAVRLAKQGAGLFESFYGLDYTSGFRTTLPDLPQLLSLGRLLAVEAALARERGEAARLGPPLAALATLAASLQSEPGLTVFHAGLALERLGLGELSRALEDPRLPRGRLAQLREVLSPVEVEGVFRRVVGLEEASLRRELPEQGGISALWAREFWRWRSAQKARGLAALAGFPCHKWAKTKRWNELPNHEARLLATLAEAQGVRAARLLVQAAWVCVRHQAEHGGMPGTLAVVPAALKPNPFTGVPLAYQPASGDLGVPGGAELWRELALPSPPPPFAVSLPVLPTEGGRR